MSPEQYVQQKAAASGSSFYYAFLFLPKDRRSAITAFYAFCREVDDVVDEMRDPGVAHTKLAWWRSEVAAAYAGAPTHPVLKALMPWAPVYGITAEHLQLMRDALQSGSEAAQDSLIQVYPDAPHAFHADYRPSYRKEAAQDAWARMLAWFRQHGVA